MGYNHSKLLVLFFVRGNLRIIMIEKMITIIKPYLPVEISEVIWDDTVFQMIGDDWSFTTLSAWRMIANNKMALGCFDKNSEDIIKILTGLQIIDLDFQNRMEIDPIFLLSNNLKIEIFSTDTYEPWTFRVKDSGLFTATPAEPSAFIKKSKLI